MLSFPLRHRCGTLPETEPSPWASGHLVMGSPTQGFVVYSWHLILSNRDWEPKETASPRLTDLNPKVMSKSHFHCHLEMKQAITQKGSPKVRMSSEIGKRLGGGRDSIGLL